MTDLKPCPFCKSDDVKVDCGPYGNWYVICNGGCRADVGCNCVSFAERFSKNDAINVWNTRPREAELEAEIAKLRSQITDPRTVTITRTRYDKYQAAEDRLAAYEGQLTAEEMRERCAFGVWSFLNNVLIHEDAQTVLEDEAAVAIRALSTKREEG